ncbi:MULTISPECIES: BON domain-containing protein [Microbacterium]|uniref:BON domain-containing protein n=1 Tax=Microbacterium TaxID=33882 RepID=UPI00146E9CEE|nr:MULTISPECIES: BON domain-containing protein [Microbacterium]
MPTATRDDRAIKTDVEEELDWTPEVDAAGVGVAVEDGTVTLSGEIDTMAERIAARRAALRVRGVRALVDDMVIHPRAAWPVTETDIAKQVDRALRAAINVPDAVKAQIRDHTVTLVGEVDWEYQRVAARRAAEYLRGVVRVENQITLRSRPSAHDTEKRIRDALTRNALLDAQTIHVSVEGSNVVLTGVVHSWAEKSQAGYAAWSSPHVMDVDNRISVEPLQ